MLRPTTNSPACRPDKNDMTVLALEDAARAEAAQYDLFAPQATVIELITGEAGENVFGEGLKSALAEIERLEQSYLELFLGKRIVTTETRRYVVYPQADKKQYLVCRFSPAAGLLPESDLSGDMVLLQIEPSGNTSNALEASAKETSVVACRVADPSVCTVIAGGREYARAVLPLFEFGRTINVAPAAPQIIPSDGLHVAHGGAARRSCAASGTAPSPMRCAVYGAPCGLNYGVSLPTLRTLARAEARRSRFRQIPLAAGCPLTCALPRCTSPIRRALRPGSSPSWGDRASSIPKSPRRPPSRC